MATTSEPALDAPALMRRVDLRRALTGASGVGALLATALLFTILKSGVFLTSANLNLILSQAAVTAILAAGLSVSLVAGEFDLSFGAVVAIGGVLVAKLLNAGVPWPVAVLATVLAAGLIGLANGGLVTAGKVPSIIATLGVASLLSGLVSWWTNGAFITIANDGFVSFGRSSAIGVATAAWIMVAVCGAGAVFMRYLVIGRNLQAVGRNPEASRLAGIAVRRYVAGALAVTAAFAGVAAWLQSAKLGAGHPEVGPGFLLPAFAAAYVGAAASRSGTFSFMGSLYGAILLAMLTNGLIIVNAPDWSADVVTGAVLLLAVSLSRVARARLDRGRR